MCLKPPNRHHYPTNGKMRDLFCPNPYLLLMTISFLAFEA